MTDTQLRLFIFLTLLTVFAVLEFILPRRSRPVPRKQRWLQNFAFTIIDSVVARFTLGAIPILIAQKYEADGYGLIGFLQLQGTLALALGYILLELMIYLQHVIFHYVPLLWSFHKVHHSDNDLDVSSGFRFHPIEIVASLGIKVLGVLAIGPSVACVLWFEILLNAGSLFNHSNINLPIWFDRILRWFIVTPDMHRIHHSIEPQETNSNFSFTLSFWDRVFGTYKKEPKTGQKNMIIGLSEEQEILQKSWIHPWLLPFKR